MSLHCHMSVEMVQSAVGLLASVPATLVHALDFLVSSPRPLMLLSARNRNKRVDLESRILISTGQGMRRSSSPETAEGRPIPPVNRIATQRTAPGLEGGQHGNQHLPGLPVVESPRQGSGGRRDGLGLWARQAAGCNRPSQDEVERTNSGPRDADSHEGCPGAEGRRGSIVHAHRSGSQPRWTDL